jgi:hypothetical protein
MSPPRLSAEQLQAAVNALAEHGGNKTKAAQSLGLRRSTFRERLVAAGDMLGAGEPIQDQFTTYEQIHGAERPRVRIKVWTPDTPPEGPVYRVLGIGDVHKKPGRTDEPVILAARHAAATRPDRIVAIGDWLSLDSCSFHPPKGSARDSERPAFYEDIEAGEESLDAFDKNCPDDIARDITFGNHEARAWRMADSDPRIAGDFPLRVEQVFARFRWRTHAYGKMLYLGGVGFIHVPLNQMTREYGGKNSENTIGNDATHSIVWGHDHRFRTKTVPKIGPNNRITLCNLGTCMPWGEIEDYNVGTTGWTYGCVDLRIQGGLITSAKFHDILELRERYGD